MFRAVVLCDGMMLDVCDFPQIAAAMGVNPAPRRQIITPAKASEGGYAPQAFGQAAMPSPYALSAIDAAGHMRKLEEVESEIIRLAISRYDGHMSEVARRLGIGRSTLYRKLKELGLEETDAGDESLKAAG